MSEMLKVHHNAGEGYNLYITQGGGQQYRGIKVRNRACKVTRWSTVHVICKEIAIGLQPHEIPTQRTPCEILLVPVTGMVSCYKTMEITRITPITCKHWYKHQKYFQHWPISTSCGAYNIIPQAVLNSWYWPMGYLWQYCIGYPPANFPYYSTLSVI